PTPCASREPGAGLRGRSPGRLPPRVAATLRAGVEPRRAVQRGRQAGGAERPAAVGRRPAPASPAELSPARPPPDSIGELLPSCRALCYLIYLKLISIALQASVIRSRHVGSEDWTREVPATTE